MMKTAFAVFSVMYVIGIPSAYGSFVKGQMPSLQQEEQGDVEDQPADKFIELDESVERLAALVKKNTDELGSCWNVETAEETGKQYRKVFSDPFLAMVYDVRYCDENANGVIDRRDDLSFFMLDPKTKRIAAQGIDYGLDGFLPLLKASGLGGEMFVAQYDDIIFWGRPPGELTDKDKETIQTVDEYYREIVQLMLYTPTLYRPRETNYK